MYLTYPQLESTWSATNITFLVTLLIRRIKTCQYNLVCRTVSEHQQQYTILMSFNSPNWTESKGKEILPKLHNFNYVSSWWLYGDGLQRLFFSILDYRGCLQSGLSYNCEEIFKWKLLCFITKTGFDVLDRELYIALKHLVIWGFWKEFHSTIFLEITLIERRDCKENRNDKCS